MESMKAGLPGICEKEALVKALAAGSLIRSGDGRVRIPEDRFFVSDAIIAELV